MKKILTPLLLALLGLGAGIGAGLALRPAPQAEAGTCAAAEPAEGHSAEPAPGCPPSETDPFAATPPAHGEPKSEGEAAYVSMGKPFVVPVFSGEKTVAMVVLSLAVETNAEAAPVVEGVEPRLRDSFLKAMFRHANTGGFDGGFTTGPKMEDLKSALLAAAREVLPETPVDAVLITEIARQDG